MERPEGWEIHPERLYRPPQTGDVELDDMLFEWRWRRKRHCERDVGDPHQHCAICGDLLAQHTGGMQCASE